MMNIFHQTTVKYIPSPPFDPHIASQINPAWPGPHGHHILGRLTPYPASTAVTAAAAHHSWPGLLMPRYTLFYVTVRMLTQFTNFMMHQWIQDPQVYKRYNRKGFVWVVFFWLQGMWALTSPARGSNPHTPSLEGDS